MYNRKKLVSKIEPWGRKKILSIIFIKLFDKKNLKNFCNDVLDGSEDLWPYAVMILFYIFHF